jgi:hypothetical protein
MRAVVAISASRLTTELFDLSTERRDPFGHRVPR